VSRRTCQSMEDGSRSGRPRPSPDEPRRGKGRAASRASAARVFWGTPCYHHAGRIAIGRVSTEGFEEWMTRKVISRAEWIF
jgi:hypothetical protein